MITLAIDTATMTQSVAVARDGAVVVSLQVAARRGHAPRLAGNVQSALGQVDATLSDVERIVVGIGPGSFTGLRIGLAFAKGVATALHLGIVPIRSFVGIAAALPRGGRVAIATDARKKQVFGAIYETGPDARPILEESSLYPAQFAAALAESDATWACGTGFELYPDALPIPESATRLPRLFDAPPAAGLLVSTAGMQAEPRAAERIEPRYLRASDAELSLRKKSARSDSSA